MAAVSVVIPTEGLHPLHPCTRLSVGLSPLANGICIEKVQRVFTGHHIDGEIVVADNSTDRTPEIAKHHGARVVVPDEHGYGNAYRSRICASIRGLHRDGGW